MDIGARIAAWRRAKGWSQQELAEACGVTVAAVYQWEPGLKKDGDPKTTITPSLVMVERVAKSLGLTMERFYGRVPARRKSAS